MIKSDIVKKPSKLVSMVAGPLEDKNYINSLFIILIYMYQTSPFLTITISKVQWIFWWFPNKYHHKVEHILGLGQPYLTYP